MCGLPGSGKSYFIDNTDFGCFDAHLIRPQDWDPEDFNEYDKETQGIIRVELWKHAIYKVSELLHIKCNNSIIIFDTCGANRLTDLFNYADSSGHDILICYVNSKLEFCYNNCNKDIVDSYVSKINKIINFFNINDIKIFEVINNGNDLTNCSNKLIDYVKTICS